MRTVAIVNQKGGVGKTTTSVNLAAALAAVGQRVLVIDMDPQANSTSWLGQDKTASPSMYDVLTEEFHPRVVCPVSQVVRATNVEGVRIAPATRKMATTDLALALEPGGMGIHHLRGTMAGLADRYDFTLIDCPPSLGMLSACALNAADEIIIPLEPEHLSLEGIQELWQTILKVRMSNHTLVVTGLLINQFIAVGTARSEVVTRVENWFGPLVFDTRISKDIRLEECPAYRLPILQRAPAGRAAQQFRDLAAEVLDAKRTAVAHAAFQSIITGNGNGRG